MGKSLFDRVYAAAFPHASTPSFFVMPRARSTMAFSYGAELGDDAHLCRLDKGDGSSQKIYGLLRFLGDSTLADSVPQAFHLHQHGPYFVTLLEVLQGTPLDPSDCAPAAVLPRIADWLARLATQTPRDLDFELPDIAANAAPWQRQLIGRYHRGWDSLLAHGDPRPEHFLDNAGTLCVYDWETAALAPPLYDWFYYLTYYTQSRYSLDDVSPEAAWERAFFSDSEDPITLRQCTLALASELHISKREIADLLRLFFVISVVPTHWRASPNAQRELLERVLSRRNIFDFAAAGAHLDLSA